MSTSSSWLTNQELVEMNFQKLRVGRFYRLRADTPFWKRLPWSREREELAKGRKPFDCLSAGSLVFLTKIMQKQTESVWVQVIHGEIIGFLYWDLTAFDRLAKEERVNTQEG